VSSGFQRNVYAVFLSAFAIAALSANVQAAPKKELILSVKGEPFQGFDPLLGWGRTGYSLFYSTLLRRDADMHTWPDIAKTWDLSEDRLTWTVTIRDDVRFSDGSPLTANDVAFSFNTAAKSGGPVDVTALQSAEAVNSTTVKLRLKHPSVTFIHNFYTLGIVPTKAYGDGNGFGANPVGSGAYKFVGWRRGEQLSVEANPLFYGTKPHFERLTFVFVADDTAFAAAMAGKLDVVAVQSHLANHVPEGMKRVVAKSIDNRGLVFPMVPNTGKKTAGGAPIGNNVTSDKAIRQAVNIAVDRRALVEGVLLGHGRPAYGPADLMPWGHPEDRITDADPKKAEQILEDAGWKRTASGIREKNGTLAKFSIVTFAGDSVREMLAIAVSDALRPVGIEVEVRTLSSNDVKRLSSSNVTLLGYGSHNPRDVFNLFDSKLAGHGFYNVGFYENPKVDAYLAKAQRASSIEDSTAHLRRAQWDGETGFGVRGDVSWAWLVTMDHVYFFNNCIDPGKLQIEPHGLGWPITAGILDWRWICK
jgi:peptide/nickel transport system substrate-binding protein